MTNASAGHSNEHLFRFKPRRDIPTAARRIVDNPHFDNEKRWKFRVSLRLNNNITKKNQVIRRNVCMDNCYQL